MKIAARGHQRRVPERLPNGGEVGASAQSVRSVRMAQDVFYSQGGRYAQQVASGVFVCMAVLISSSTERARLLVRAGIRRFNVLLSSHQLPGARV